MGKLASVEHVEHPIPPLYNADSRILILGSFPSVKSRESMFFYGHPQNRFWRLLATLFNEPVPQSVEEKKRLALKHGVALWDVLASCDIVGSSDASIQNPTPNDIEKILNESSVEHIFTNGKTAYTFYNRYLLEKTGKKAELLPSTSPANAAWNFERLLDAWKIIL